ncbi:MAG: transcription termination/antitermination protein NusA, partial [Chloroflexi bacterium]|nr:transcription termination/antitermination protein NusA [Chloroflexota bacterium]
AMVSAYRRAVNASNAQEVVAKIDSETGKVTIFAEKEVVEDVQDQRTEVTLEVARTVNPEANLSDIVVVESTPTDFGRVAAQTARQVIQQRIREAERQMQADFFNKQVGEIISGVVQAVSMTQGVTIGLDMKAEGIMPPNQKIPGERFKVHERIRSIVLEVKDSPRGPQIILSRSHRNFLRRLMENEVPEIYHGIVEIRAISREPGQRAKVAVSATQPNVDPVGACVGIKGVRIQAIVKELHDEKIDIIEWNADQVLYISKAISPAKVSGVYLNEAEKTATVVVQEDQLSLAIGRDGQNARLAAKLTGWRIDIKSLIEAAADAIVKVQRDPSLANIAEVEHKNIPIVEGVLAKKSEGRPVTPEEFMTLIQFVERVERRTVEQKKATAAAEEERVSAARSEVPNAAFEAGIDALGLPERIYNILTEAEHRTVGELMMAMKLNPDSVLGLAGIGPKSLEAIKTALENISFPEPEPTVEPVAEIPVEVVAEAPVETGTETAPAEVLPEPVLAEGEAAPVVAEITEEKDKEKPLEEIFTLRPDMLLPVAVVAEDDEDESDKKKDKKKKKKVVEIVYDEDLEKAIALKKHKRGEEGWEEE